MMYECNQVNFDIALSMSTLDAFAHYGDFPDRVEAELNRHASFDLTRIGFFGKAASDNSDPNTNPNGE
ncbi:P2 family phage major capsid protein, partial [uncultured Vibrio sp.]